MVGGFGNERQKQLDVLERISKIIKCLLFNCRSNTQEEFVKDLVSRQVITSLLQIFADINVASSAHDFTTSMGTMTLRPYSTSHNYITTQDH